MRYLAGFDINRRQRVISSTDKLKEMMGGSWSIAETVRLAEEFRGRYNGKIEIQSPVSGELRFTSDDLDALGAFLWDLREYFVEKLDFPCVFAVVDGSEEELKRQVAAEKAARAGEVAPPALPWFAPCQIQPDRFATRWLPALAKDPQNRRRALMNHGSVARLERGDKTLKEYLDSFESLRGYGFERPYEFSDFTVGNDGSYLALIRLDVDEATRFFGGVELGQLRKYSESLDDCLKTSLRKAVDAAIRECYDKSRPAPKTPFPVSPLIAEGDDFLILSRRDFALGLFLKLQDSFSAEVRESEILTERIATTGARLTLSGSILYARAAFPYSVMSQMSDSLERSAKDHRREMDLGEGCLDLHWLESTAREDVIETRNRELKFRHGGVTFRLFTRPWSSSQAKAMLEASALVAAIPRGKWHQLFEALRLGDAYSRFAYRDWLLHLGEHRKPFEAATKSLRSVDLWPSGADAEPWRTDWSTPLTELYLISEASRVARWRESPNSVEVVRP